MPDYPTIEACIGETPLVRLQRLPGDTSNTILAKLEGNNPAGSVKDVLPWPWRQRYAATG
jgi:cysteine synthase B